MKVNKPSPTSPGLSDLWAQHGCHRSSTHSSLGMFVYIQAPHPCLSLCRSVSLPLSSSSLSDLLQCGRQLGGWVNRGGEENGKRRGWVKEEVELPLFFFFCAHAQWPPPLLVTLFIAVGYIRLGLMEEEVFGVGLPPAEHRPHRLTDAWL